MTTKQKQKSMNFNLPAYSVIKKASGGDVEAINIILKHYKNYIMALCLQRFYDRYGNPHTYVDEEMRRRLETKLITKILNFKII